MMVTTKQSLYNEIILMRPLIRQVKVHIIHKLRKNVKIYKQERGIKVELQKNKEKINRWMEEILTLKAFKDDDISKLVILGPQRKHTCLSDINSKNRHRVLKKVMAYSKITDRFKEIREKFSECTIIDYFKTMEKESKISTIKKEKENKNKKNTDETSDCENVLRDILEWSTVRTKVFLNTYKNGYKIVQYLHPAFIKRFQKTKIVKFESGIKICD